MLQPVFRTAQTSVEGRYILFSFCSVRKLLLWLPYPNLSVSYSTNNNKLHSTFNKTPRQNTSLSTTALNNSRLKTLAISLAKIFQDANECTSRIHFQCGSTSKSSDPLQTSQSICNKLYREKWLLLQGCSTKRRQLQGSF